MAAFDLTTEETPKIAGRYRALRQIGSGGTATVFLAEDELLRRLVAIKRLRSGGSSDERQRILREARVGAGLSHPALATIFDVIADPEETLVVMQYVDGCPLSELIPPGGLDPARLVGILRPIASALDHAHRHGVVHRDVKPSNILISDAGEVRLVDLGAAIAPDVTRITDENKVIGTLAYIAPERLTGEDPGGPASDVYSLAVTAFEALTGTAALAARSPAEALAELASGPPSLRERLPSAPPALALAVSRGMQRDPRRRQRSAVELIAQIDVAARAPAPSARPRAAPPERAADTAEGSGAEDTDPGPTVVSTPPTRRRQAILAIAGGLVVIGAVAVALFALAGVSSSPGGRTGHGGGGTVAKPGGGRASASAGGSSAKAGGGSSGVSSSISSASSTPSTAASSAPSVAAPPAGSTAAPVTAPVTAAPASGLSGSALGAALNDRGYALIQAGDYAAAVPILRRAVAAFPRDSTELVYGYALYNLAHALRLSGHPAAAIPLLRRRLRIPDQIPTVRAELAAARAAAGGP